MKSIQAKTAKAIRQELKQEFPEDKFSVTSEGFSGGTAVRISWIDGVTMDQVRKIADKYQYGSFNGMIDMYEMDNRDADIPQVKYVTYSRSYSDETVEKIVNHIRENHMNCENFSMNEYSEEFREYGSTIVWRRFIDMDLTKSTVEECLKERVVA